MPDQKGEDESVRTADVPSAARKGNVHRHPMVGVGGSAGSIPVLRSLFADMPPDAGISFVVVLHLARDFESNLPGILQSVTPMKVIQVNDSVRVEPNHVYVIPPNRALVAVDGMLKVQPLEDIPGKRLAVDRFFRTLADCYGPRAISVILSGSGSDGAIGLKRVKERGGLTIAQDPAEAEHEEMPRAAIATGMVDWILPSKAMPARIQQYLDLGERLALSVPDPDTETAEPVDLDDPVLEILDYVRHRTGRNFTDYKPATVLRRLGRRMQITGITELPEYLRYLQTHAGECSALVQDLLISVTHFFRDREAFEALASRIPELFMGKGPENPVRVWVIACATGEEAYAIAILMLEHARTLPNPPPIQIFATDLDHQAIQMARTGFYPTAVEADVSEARLAQFFTREVDGYRVRPELRSVVLFAIHDVLTDAPFSRLDLISCRNLLSYLAVSAQRRVLQIMHFALRPHGTLLLGSTEAVTPADHLYTVLDKANRIFAPQRVSRVPLPASTNLPAVAQAWRGPRSAESTIPTRKVPAFRIATFSGGEALKETGAGFESVRDLHARLLERIGPASVLINQANEIVHLSESAAGLLQYAGGEPTTQLLRAIHPLLRHDLRATLFRASESGQEAESPGTRLQMGDTERRVVIRVAPAGEMAPGWRLVTFDLRQDPAGTAVEPQDARHDLAVRQLEQELERMQARLHEVVQQYEASNEEMKSSNEELQSINEELRSTTEELETSREELQSTNEELVTVNQDLKNTVEELRDTNSDLHNLMAASAIPTIFLDRKLRITRFTPPAVDLFHLIPSDAGRPLTHLHNRLEYPGLEVDAKDALTNLRPVEREVALRDVNGWYLARWVPYRTVGNELAGVVLTMVDITEIRQARHEVEASQHDLLVSLEETQRARAIAESALETKDRFLAMLSHELRTPLNPVLMGIHLLQREK
ncbi:MAG TPA: chemotaxis protein CheB, partial [Gemmatimonadales bacterium]|nr:chemotaxis protein CheB [Gemmatimonadales bacterium]